MSTATEIPDCPVPCVCAGCDKQYRSLGQQGTKLLMYTSAIDDSTAGAQCTESMRRINKNRAFIQREMNLRGKGIVKRWKRRTQKNREQILKSVDPTIHERNWHEAQIPYDARYND